VIIGLYTILALLLTYPLVTHFTTHVPGTDIWAFDEYTFLWNIWWFNHSLLDLHTNPLFTDYIFYPLGISLALYTYNLFNALISLPLQPFLNLATISNLTLIFALVFSGYGTYLLVLYLLRHRAGLAHHCAAFLAGALYAFGSYRFVYAALGHYDMVTTQWIPFYALFMVKSVREQGLRNAVLAGLFATLALLSEMIFGVFLLFLTVIYLLFARREMNWGLMKRVASLVAVVVVTYFPLGYPIVRELLSADYALPGWGHSENLLVDLFGFTTPTALHPLLGSDWIRELTMVREGTARFIDVNTVYLGWVAIILGIVAAIRYWPELKAWVVSAGTFALLCLGPLLHINGRSTFDLDGLLVNVPLPFIILHYIPIVKANRVPNRFSVVLMLALAVLVGFSAYGILRRMKRRSLLLAGTALLWVLLSFEHLALPLPLTDARVPDFYYTLAAEPGDFAILQFPLGWRNSFGVLGAERTQIQYYQSVHRKRMLGGNISRNPPFKFDYFRRIPIFASIADLELYGEVTPEQLERDRALAPDLLYFFDIRYLIFHPGIPGRPPYIDIRSRLEEYVQHVFPVRKILDEDGFTVYKVEQPSPLTELTVDFGIPEARIYQGEGWSWDEVLDGSSANWATQEGARFFVPLRESGDYTMHIRAKAFSYPGSPPQRVAVRVNGHSLPSQEVNPGWTDLILQVPASFLHPGLNQVALDFAYLASPHDIFPGNFAVGETGVTSPVEIDVNSSLEFAYITVGGMDASTHRRGYNLAVIDPQSGAVIDKAGFDTGDNESQTLTDFIADIPKGYIVVAALKEGGAQSLTEEAVEALTSLGGEIDLRGTEHLSHAIIGVKGAAPGTALEATGEGNSYLHVGKNPDERTLALAVDLVSLIKR